MQNITKRKDGRWQYSKMINGKRIFLYAKTQQELIKKVKENKPKRIYTKSTKTTFYTIAQEWINLYKNTVKSKNNYTNCLKKHLNNEIFKKDIKTIKYQELQESLMNIKATRMAEYSYFLIKGVYKEALKREIIEKDISQLLDKPKHITQKGSALKIKEQKLLLENIEQSEIKEEILFYILTGCRRTEAVNIKYNDIDFEHLTIHIKGTKTNNANRYIPISKTYAEYLKTNFKYMFKEQKDYYTHKFKQFIDKIGIKDKTLHDLRHTYSTNLYYLGVPDKQRQLYMGHASIVMTNDIYTTLEPNITKKDILNLYKDLYPKF